jgi:hypothetical protein
MISKQMLMMSTKLVNNSMLAKGQSILFKNNCIKSATNMNSTPPSMYTHVMMSNQQFENLNNIRIRSKKMSYHASSKNLIKITQVIGKICKMSFYYSTVRMKDLESISKKQHKMLFNSSYN